ncbi:MAG TPA: hypothetical protein VFV34_11995 [Blastocatellia bacterium]|nr:hypothetical protein [Blastocatellia bacterium]
MNRKDLIFISILAGVLGIFIFLSAIKRPVPQLSVREEHQGMSQGTSPDTCLACHDPGSQIAPMGARHPKKGRPPKKDDCFLCHKPPAAAVTAFTLPATEQGR